MLRHQVAHDLDQLGDGVVIFAGQVEVIVVDAFDIGVQSDAVRSVMQVSVDAVALAAGGEHFDGILTVILSSAISDESATGKACDHFGDVKGGGIVVGQVGVDSVCHDFLFFLPFGLALEPLAR